MGFFSKLLGGTPDYPALDPQNPAAKKIQAVEDKLTELGHQTKDPMEIVPTSEKTYVFVGKPPKQFGLAWVDSGGVHYLKNYTAERNIDTKKALKLMEALGQAYERSTSESRYAYRAGDRNFVVTPSENLAVEVDRILEKGVS